MNWNGKYKSIGKAANLSACVQFTDINLYYYQGVTATQAKKLVRTKAD